MQLEHKTKTLLITFLFHFSQQIKEDSLVKPYFYLQKAELSCLVAQFLNNELMISPKDCFVGGTLLVCKVMLMIAFQQFSFSFSFFLF